MSNAVTLPSWAKLSASSAHLISEKIAGCVVVDSDAAYEEWLEILVEGDYVVPGFDKPTSRDAIDQFFVEVAYQCIKLEVQAGVVNTDLDPRKAGKPLEIHFSKGEVGRLSNYPEGLGVALATKGKVARRFYKAIRGPLPF